MITKPFRTDPLFGSALPPKDSGIDLRDPMDSAGQATLELLHRAATTAKESSSEAIDTIHELSVQLQTANNRIRELEGKVEHYQVRAERAERWFATISAEIQRQFLDVFDKSGGQPPRHPHFRLASSQQGT